MDLLVQEEVRRASIMTMFKRLLYRWLRFRRAAEISCPIRFVGAAHELPKLDRQRKQKAE